MGDYEIVCADVVKWAESYSGDPFHAIICDPPYNLDTITHRFGKSDSAPAKHGRDGRFARLSKHWRGETWDTDVAFHVETWRALMKVLLPGAFIFAYGGARCYWRMAAAMDQAGLVIHPNLFCWAQGQAMPYAHQVSRLAGNHGWQNKQSGWEGYYHGRGTLKPSVEPIILAQNPFGNSPIEDILTYGAGAYNVDGGRFSQENRWPGTLVLVHSERCTNGSCQFDCPVALLEDKANYFYHTNWAMEVFERVINVDPVIYANKVNKKERRAGLDNDADHPTLKPIGLNFYLANLLLPPRKISPRRLLVPFSGVASEMIGGLYAGWDQVVGVEIDQHYCELADRRTKYYLDLCENNCVPLEVRKGIYYKEQDV